MMNCHFNEFLTNPAKRTHKNERTHWWRLREIINRLLFWGGGTEVVGMPTGGMQHQKAGLPFAVWKNWGKLGDPPVVVGKKKKKGVSLAASNKSEKENPQQFGGKASEH